MFIVRFEFFGLTFFGETRAMLNSEITVHLLGSFDGFQLGENIRECVYYFT